MKTKAHIVLVAVMALFTAATAQNVNFGESFVLDSALNPNQSHEYTARDYIELKKGFFSEPILENHTALQVDTELNCIFPPEEGLTNSNGCVNALFQNNPNPFNTVTTITFNLQDGAKKASIIIYDLNGIQIVEYPISDESTNCISIDANIFQPGIYLYSLLVDDKLIDTKRMVITTK